MINSTGDKAAWRARLSMYLEDLLRIKAVFGTEGISYAVLKGPHISSLAYDNLTERTYSDLDVLVGPSAHARAFSALLAAGFRHDNLEGKRAISQVRFSCCELGSPHGFVLELHRDLAGYERYHVDVDALLARAEPFSFLGQSFLGLSRRDLLPHLCLHIIKSYFLGVEEKHFRDIDHVIKNGNTNWEEFVRTVSLWRCKYGAHYVLKCVQAQHGTSIPEEIMAELRPSKLRRAWMDRWIDIQSMPPYRYKGHGMFQYQWRLGLPLMDRKRDWLLFVIKYGVLRLADEGYTLINGHRHGKASTGEIHR